MRGRAPLRAPVFDSRFRPRDSSGKRETRNGNTQKRGRKSKRRAVWKSTNNNMGGKWCWAPRLIGRVNDLSGHGTAMHDMKGHDLQGHGHGKPPGQIWLPGTPTFERHCRQAPMPVFLFSEWPGMCAMCVRGRWASLAHPVPFFRGSLKHPHVMWVPGL